MVAAADRNRVIWERLRLRVPQPESEGALALLLE